MRRSTRFKLIYIVFALVVTQGFIYYGRVNADFIENWYSMGNNVSVRQFLSKMTGGMPFSLGEVLILACVFILPLLFLFSLGKALRAGEPFKALRSTILNAIMTVLTLYVLFIWIWGLNYYRQSVYEMYDYDNSGYSTGELITFTEFVVNETIELRRELPEKNIVWDDKALFAQLDEEMEKLTVNYPELQGDYGPAKPVFFSQQMMHTGIVGIYFPFTGEANVNVEEFDTMIPYTALHEMSHQRGIAHEDACNYYAYLLSRESEDIRVRYSGALSVMIRAMNTLYKTDRQAYNQLRELYSTRVEVDLENYSNHWEPYRGVVEEKATELNDRYLKSNGQDSGVASYNEVINLLIQWYKGEMIDKY